MVLKLVAATVLTPSKQSLVYSGYTTDDIVAALNRTAAIATFLADPTSANLAAAMTDETGSGALVFQNSLDILDRITTQPSLDYSGESLSQMVVGSRLGTATYFDFDGVLKTAAANVPRITFDPVTRQPTGFLHEPASTNLALRSATLDNATWAKSGATVVADASTAPDGTVSADKIVESSGGTTHVIAQAGIAVTSGLMYTASFFAKAAERSVLIFQFPSAAFGATLSSWFDLSAAAVSKTSGTGTSVSRTIQSVGNGVYRCTVSAQATATVSTGNMLLLYLDNSPTGTGSYSGDGSSGLYVWGVQFEARAQATSYIPTTSASVTRAADNFYIPVDTTWFNATEGAVVVDCTPVGVAANVTTETLANLNDGTTDNIVQVRFGTSISGADFYVTTATVNQVDTSSVAVTAGTRTRLGYTYKLNDYSFTKDGAAVLTDTSATVPSGITKLNLGTAPVFVNRITYYPTKLTDAQLQAVTIGY